MRFTRRIVYRFAIVLVVAGAIGIGWVSRSIRAQDGAPRPKVASSPEALAPPEIPAPVAALPGGPGDPAPAPAASRDPFELDPSGGANPDPEKAAQVFLDQNRKVARDELKKLRDEEAQLRTRLGKVEAGIRRWDALLAALGSSDKIQGPRPARPIAAGVVPPLLETPGPARAKEPAPSAGPTPPEAAVEPPTGLPPVPQNVAAPSRDAVPPSSPPAPEATPSNDPTPPRPR